MMFENLKIDHRPKFLGWAPGDYIGNCKRCGDQFQGDKRAVVCADCAYSEIPDGFALVPVESKEKRPPYGDPILIALNGVWQHVTYTLDGADDCEDWVEPYHFDHDDSCKIFWRSVTAWIPMNELPPVIDAAQQEFTNTTEEDTV